MSEQGVSEKLIEDALRAGKDLMYDVRRDQFADQPTGSPNENDAMRAALNSILPELEAEWRERLLKRIDHVELALSGIGHIEDLLSQPHSGQPGDQGR